MATLYEELGGEERLRAIVDDFIDRVTADPMIRFFFREVDHDRLKELECQFAGRFLGAPGARYEGRPLAEAHRLHRIFGGQFLRRKQILEETLEAHDVPPHIIEAWLEHTEKLRPAITSDGGSNCEAP